MAIQFQYNKTSLQQLEKQLNVRVRALPTIKNKESALRSEVKRAKEQADEFDARLMCGRCYGSIMNTCLMSLA